MRGLPHGDHAATPLFILAGPQALLLSCGTACGVIGFFPVAQAALGWLISESLLGAPTDAIWMTAASYGACAVVMPVATVIGLGIGIAGMVEYSNITRGLGWSYGAFVPTPDPTALLVGAAVVPLRGAARGSVRADGGAHRGRPPDRAGPGRPGTRRCRRREDDDASPPWGVRRRSWAMRY